MKHYHIRIHFSDKLKLYFSKNWYCVSTCCFKHKVVLTKLINESSKKIDKMLDISKMMRNNRLFKILLKNSILNKQIAEKIQHTEKYLIDLESNLSESQDFDINEEE